MLNQLTIAELTARLAHREVSAREATQACLDRIARIDAQLHAFLSCNAADALAQTAEIEGFRLYSTDFDLCDKHTNA